jgi:hypothetical protein
MSLILTLLLEVLRKRYAQPSFYHGGSAGLSWTQLGPHNNLRTDMGIGQQQLNVPGTKCR